VLAVIALVAIVVLLFLIFMDDGGDDDPSDEQTSETPSQSSSAPSSSAPTSEATSEDTSVVLDASDYVGRPLGDVERELGDLGLRVNSQQVDNPGGKIEGDVSALNPTGRVEQGDTITVSYWGPEPTPTEPTTTPSTPDTETTPPVTDDTSPS
jgi:eukaryotic-like serine/threonine-protein kinase